MMSTEQRIFGGVYAATVCPLRDDFSPDEAALAAHCRAVSEVRGIRGLLVNGHAGENFSLDREEQNKVLEVVRRTVNSEQALIVGINHESSLEAALQAKDAAARGADALMVFPPNSWALSVAPGVVKSLGEEADMANATAEAQAAILAMQDKGEISVGQAKEIYEIVLKTGRDPEEIADSEGLKQVSDTGAIETAIDEILANNEDKVEQYRGGKDKLFGFFVGQTMKAMQGKANPAVVNQILKDKLG